MTMGFFTKRVSLSKRFDDTLFNAGAHSDVMNNQGLTAYTKCATDIARTILVSSDKSRVISLKCLCARVIKKHEVTYKTPDAPILPLDLEQFVDVHAPIP